ncbi:methionyl-tRNA formyltransferase [Aminobacter ciceronei]|uniref:Methionyl-tRNA formyltransferase n=1 Tax=Aminobacter ciceronei TaxID=150723 RepID=A0ABR6CAR2_9HYPH|nr:methionyl-tRNA formyltransferase [Aminobacter ciceronei]MBA8907963.1 methionyl-tRNA formyltransferase [Aminobacter ciceronei]MBA9021718.1 methionyl-tRNA formyltransferase [Aminobacter ciceronei]
MRIAIIGQQAFGKSVLEAFLARSDEVAGVFCAPEKSGARADPLRLAAEEHGLRLFQLPNLKSPAAEGALRALDVDLAVMAYVLQFAPQAFVNIPKHGTIQYHPSLLPAYRGPSSINWPIIKGEKETGITIFRPNDGLDEGPVILQKRVAIGPDDTLGTVYFDRLFPLGVEAMLEAADLVVAGRHTETVQDEDAASYEGWCRDGEAEINWHMHLDFLHDLIRGCDPAPGAWTTVLGQRVRLFESRKHAVRRFGDVGGKPGTITAIGDQTISIAAQGGTVEIGKVRTESGQKSSAAAFAKSHGLAVGDVFESEMRDELAEVVG